MNNPGWNGSCEDWLHGDEDLTDEQPPEEEGIKNADDITLYEK
tara:strand:+ start:1301 stop:1429 length:129 start_codon:yes stop_codon:yes gene_type:complete